MSCDTTLQLGTWGLFCVEDFRSTACWLYEQGSNNIFLIKPRSLSSAQDHVHHTAVCQFLVRVLGYTRTAPMQHACCKVVSCIPHTQCLHTLTAAHSLVYLTRQVNQAPHTAPNRSTLLLFTPLRSPNRLSLSLFCLCSNSDSGTGIKSIEMTITRPTCHTSPVLRSRCTRYLR